MSLKTNAGSSALELPLTIEEGDGEYGSPLDAPSNPGPMLYSSLSLKDLVCLCADDPRDDDAWVEFVSRVGRPIGLTVMRTASLCGKPSRSLVEDLVQETYEKLWKHRCLVRDFAIQHPDAIWGYVRKTAFHTTLDHLKRPHIPTIDIDPETESEADGSQKSIEYRILLKEIDKRLKHCLTEPHQKRDRMIFWLYFLQGMSTKEIASLPTIGLTADGVGSVIERLKHCLREQILRSRVDSEDDEG